MPNKPLATLSYKRNKPAVELALCLSPAASRSRGERPIQGAAIWPQKNNIGSSSRDLHGTHQDLRENGSAMSPKAGSREDPGPA